MTASTTSFPIPSGVHAIPEELLDLRPDSDVDHDIVNPTKVKDEKNVWFFWHSGFDSMYPYGKRTVRAWHRRLSKLGWVIRVLDRDPGSRNNVANYLDINDPELFPRAVSEGTLGGSHPAHHTSDLVRFPLLIHFGGVYADVGMIQIGDIDRLWNATIGNPDSPYKVVSYCADSTGLTNYFLASERNNPFFIRCHKLLLALWATDGGKTDTKGLHKHPLLKGVPLMKSEASFEEDGVVYGPKEVGELLSDYIVQGLAMSQVMGLIDEEDGWNGPQYVKEHFYTLNFMVGSQLINEMTMWNGPRQFELMSLQMPKDEEAENDDQRQAREIVEACLTKSFGFKLATGLILRVMGDTLSSLWRKHEGSDNAEGTYARWLRHGTVYWTQDELPARQDYEVPGVWKRGPLLRET